MAGLAWVVGIGVSLFLLFRFPRQVGLVIAGLIALGLLIWSYFYFENQKAAAELALIETEARVSAELCSDPTFPIFVSFINRSTRSLVYTSFLIQAKRPNHSQNTYSNYQSSDRIIPAGQGYANCWSVASYSKPTEPLDTLLWSIELYSARFQ